MLRAGLNLQQERLSLAYRRRLDRGWEELDRWCKASDLDIELLMSDTGRLNKALARFVQWCFENYLAY
jgi:hypothetical protein